MRIIQAVLIWLSVLLLPAVTAPSNNQARQDVEIESVNLVFQPGCHRTAPIEKAWDDAIRLLASLKKVNFDSPAAIDFFGPPGRNMEYRPFIQAVLDSAKTFGQGWRTTPTLFKVPINVYCSVNPEIDDPKCRGTVGAYTWNTEFSDGTGNQSYHERTATMNIRFCNFWFKYGDLDEHINTYKNNPNEDIRLDLRSYINRASIIVHELMHADRVTLAANGNRHITDLKMQITIGKPPPGVPKHKWINAYGPALTKILAHTNKTGIATDITINADNYALYVLATYAHEKIGIYPSYPLIYAGAGPIKPRQLVLLSDSGWSLISPNFEESLGITGDDLAFDLSDIEISANGDGVPTLTDLEWTTDDWYPRDYIRQLEELVDKASEAQPPETSSNQQIAIASYINPSGDPDTWARLLAYDTGKVSVLVANVLNGPDYIANPAWQSVIDQAAGQGKRIIGYVRTGYLGVSQQKFTTRLGSSDLADWASQIEQDVDKWYDLYGSSLGGIFFDEGWPECGPDNIYADLYAYINNYTKRKHPGAFTVLNPGSPIAQCYEDTMDALLTFENSYESYQTSYVPNDWTPKDSRKIWHIIYRVPQDQIEKVAALARSRHVGLLEITDDDNPNPYDNLPNDAYMRAVIDAVPGGEPLIEDPDPVIGGLIGGLSDPNSLVLVSSDYTSVTISWTPWDVALGYAVYVGNEFIMELPPSLNRATIGMLEPGTSNILIEIWPRVVLPVRGVHSQLVSASTTSLPESGTISNGIQTVDMKSGLITFQADVVVPYAFVRLFIRSGGELASETQDYGWPLVFKDKRVPWVGEWVGVYDYLVEGNDFYSSLYKYTGDWKRGSRDNAAWSWAPESVAKQTQSGYTYIWTIRMPDAPSTGVFWAVQGQGYAPISNIEL